MSNKAAGTRFEKEFAGILADNWFWVHLFQDNRNGQPCDVIAARDGNAYLFDCKDCQGNRFPLSRMEENQYNAMKLFRLTGNKRGMFVIRYPETGIYLVDFEVLKKLKFVVVVREQIEYRKERVHMKVGEYLKEQREQQGLSHAKLAKAAGVSKRSLIYWEQGRDMSVEVADKVLKALGATYKIGA